MERRVNDFYYSRESKCRGSWYVEAEASRERGDAKTRRCSCFD